MIARVKAFVSIHLVYRWPEIPPLAAPSILRSALDIKPQPASGMQCREFHSSFFGTFGSATLLALNAMAGARDSSLQQENRH